MSGFYQRNRDRGNYGGQNVGGGNYNQMSSFQNQGNMGGQQMMNPWQGGVMPGLQSGSDEATLAFSILNQVLASDAPMGNNVQNQRGTFQDRKNRQGLVNRLEDRRRGQSPQFMNRNRNDRNSRWSSRSRSPQRDNRSNSRQSNSNQNKKSIMDRLGRLPERDRKDDSAQKRKRSSEKEKEQHSDSKSVTNDADDSDSNEKNKKPRDKEYDETIAKCLKCHICEVDSFESIESFQSHKKSEEHKLIAEIYNQRSDAVLQVMRADAKLVANRSREKAGNANKESSYVKCPKCDCIIADAYKTHQKSIEHELVDNHVFRECCGSNFVRRKEFEDHRITIPHLKRQMEIKKENVEDNFVMANTEEEEAAGMTLRELKVEHVLELDSPADFPDFDENKPIGLSYVHKKRRYNCTLCKKIFPSFNNMALAHCRSFNHYLMLLTHLETKLQDVEDEIEPSDTEEKEEQEEEVVKEEEEEEDLAKDQGSVNEANEEEDMPEEENEENKIEDEEGNEDYEEDPANEDPVADEEEKEVMEEDKSGVSDRENEDLEEMETNVVAEVEEKEEELEEEEEKEKKEEEEEEEEEKKEEKEDDEEEEEEVVEEVKPKATRGRRGRGKGRGSRKKFSF